MRQKYRAALAAACLGALVSGCSSYSGPFDGYYDTRSSQPLGTGSGASVCSPLELGGNITHAMDQFGNGDLDRDVTIDRVRLLDPVGVHLVQAEMSVNDVPGGQPATGLLQGWPAAPNGADDPEDPEDPPVAQWSKAIPAIGQTITTKRDRGHLLVLRLRADAVPRATLAGVEIEYHDRTGRAFRSSGGYELTLLDPDSDRRCF